MANTKKEVAKKTATTAKKAVKKSVEKPTTGNSRYGKVELTDKEVATAMQRSQKRNVDVDCVVKITIDGTENRAIVTGVHEGGKIDAVVQPVGADNYSIGSVPYASDTDLEPYWNF